MQSAKEAILHLWEKIPDDTPYNEILYEIQFNRSIELGLEDIREGRVFTSEEAFQRLKKWLK